MATKRFNNPAQGGGKRDKSSKAYVASAAVGAAAGIGGTMLASEGEEQDVTPSTETTATETPETTTTETPETTTTETPETTATETPETTSEETSPETTATSEPAAGLAPSPGSDPTLGHDPTPSTDPTPDPTPGGSFNIEEIDPTADDQPMAFHVSGIHSFTNEEGEEVLGARLVDDDGEFICYLVDKNGDGLFNELVDDSGIYLGTADEVLSIPMDLTLGDLENLYDPTGEYINPQVASYEPTGDDPTADMVTLGGGQDDENLLASNDVKAEESQEEDDGYIEGQPFEENTDDVDGIDGLTDEEIYAQIFGDDDDDEELYVYEDDPGYDDDDNDDDDDDDDDFLADNDDDDFASDMFDADEV